MLLISLSYNNNNHDEISIICSILGKPGIVRSFVRSFGRLFIILARSCMRIQTVTMDGRSGRPLISSTQAS